MVALRLYVGLLLMPIRAEAVAPWNSTDMSSKTATDKQTQGQKGSELHALRAASGTADSLLSGNETILKVMQDQLKTSENTNFKMKQAITKTEETLQHSEKVLAQKGKELAESIKTASETAESLKHAHAALEVAEKTKVQKYAAKQTASTNLSLAEDKLQKKIICCIPEIPAAKHDVELKQKDLKDASAALAEAEKAQAAKQKALELTEAKNTKAVEARAKAKKAYQDAAGMVDRAKTYLDQLKAKDANPQKVIDAIKASVEKQVGVVNTLKHNSKELHKKVAAKKSEFDEISAAVEKDVKCISRLQDCEGSLGLNTLRVKKATDAYMSAGEDVQKTLKGPLWQLKDQEAVAANGLYKVQEDCAPKNITLPEEPPLPDCPDDTSGTCAWFKCHPYRHSVCSPDFECVCPPGTCSNKGGVCEDRGSPVLLAGPPTEPRAPPAAAAGTALLAAAALTFAALLVMRRRRAPEVHMPQDVLG